MVSKSILLFLLVFVFQLYPSNVVYAQKLNEDSLVNVINTEKNDSIRIYTMLKLANYLLNHEQKKERGLALTDSAKKLAIANRFYSLSLQANNIMGNYYTNSNQWEKSIEVFTQTLNEAELLKDPAQKAKSRMMLLSNLGNIYLMNGDFQTSLEYHLQSLEIVEKMKPVNYNSLATVYINVANDYSELNMDTKAVDYLKKIEKIADSITQRLRLTTHILSYDIYSKLRNEPDILAIIGQMENGIDKYSLSSVQKMDAIYCISYMRGDYETEYKKNHTAAIAYYQKAMGQAVAMDDDRKKSFIFYKLGKASLELNRLEEAKSHLLKGIALCNETDMTDQRSDMSLAIASAYYRSGEYRKAADHYLIAKNLTDSIYNDNRSKELNFLEAKSRAKKKKKEIADLTLSNTQKELTVVKRNRLILIGGISAASLVLVLASLYRSSHQKRLIAEKDKLLKDEEVKFLEKQQQIVSMQSMVNGQETERSRIAKDLHDGLGGLFSTIKMYFSTLKHEQDVLKENELFGKSYEMIDTASEEVRRIAHNMMPEVLMKLGLVAATQDMCSNISAGKLLQVKLQSYGMDERLNESTEAMLYRIIQELLNNIIKHAHATEAIVQFNRNDNRLTVTVEDNGRGFNTLETDAKNHAGLETIKNRVTYLNGNISIDSQQEVGTTVMMEFLLNTEN